MAVIESRSWIGLGVTSLPGWELSMRLAVFKPSSQFGTAGA